MSILNRLTKLWNPYPDGITPALAKSLAELEKKFTPADPSVDWIRVETLVHGPGASEVQSENHGDGNSAVFSCLMAISMSYTEPPLRVFRRQKQGRHTWLESHPLQVLLQNPMLVKFGTGLSAEEFWFWTQWAKHCDGNAYWLKTRSGDSITGNVIGLSLASPELLKPYTERDSNDFISYYNLQVRPGVFERVAVQNVVHFRLGVDYQDIRIGLSPLKRLLRQISTDSEADRFTETLLKNFAVPGLVVITKEPTDEDQAKLIKARIRSNFGSDNRGNVGVVSNDARVEQFGFSPEQLNLAVLHRVPEERIAAVMRVPPIVANLGAGLEHSTYSNYIQAREAFTEDSLVPLWRMDAATINRQL